MRSCTSREKLILLSLLFASACGSGGPDVTTAELDTAVSRAASAGKVVFLEFGATWCAPCKRLEETTLKDPRVRAWLDERAVSLHVDIDEFPELAAGFGVRSVPRMVFLRPDRTVLGSITGYCDADAFLAAAEQRMRGVSALDESAVTVADDPKDVNARRLHFGELRSAGQPAEALKQARIYWQASRSAPSQSGVRVSFFLNEMQAFADEYPPAALELERWLTDASAQLDAGGTAALPAAMELAALAGKLGRAELIMKTVERLADSPALPLLTLAAGDTLLAGKHYSVLVDSGICELAAVKTRLNPPPLPVSMMKDNPELAVALRQSRIGQAALPFEALAGVERETDALEIAALVLGGDDDADVRKRLAKAAERAGNADLAKQLRDGP